jgi:hypothetical protein
VRGAWHDGQLAVLHSGPHGFLVLDGDQVVVASHDQRQR